MTKADLVNNIANKTGLEKKAVLAVIEQLMTEVKDSLAADENVYLRGFGTFAVRKRAQKAARNITKNTTVIIPAHKAPTFKPAKVFAEALQK